MIKQPNESIDVNTSLDLTEMAKLKAIIFDTPEAEHAKIEFIKEELASGRYPINSDHIAAKLLEFAPMNEEVEMA